MSDPIQLIALFSLSSEEHSQVLKPKLFITLCSPYWSQAHRTKVFIEVSLSKFYPHLSATSDASTSRRPPYPNPQLQYQSLQYWNSPFYEPSKHGLPLPLSAVLNCKSSYFVLFLSIYILFDQPISFSRSVTMTLISFETQSTQLKMRQILVD